MLILKSLYEQQKKIKNIFKLYNLTINIYDSNINNRHIKILKQFSLNMRTVFKTVFSRYNHTIN